MVRGTSPPTPSPLPSPSSWHVSPASEQDSYLQACWYALSHLCVQCQTERFMGLPGAGSDKHLGAQLTGDIIYCCHMRGTMLWLHLPVTLCSKSSTWNMVFMKQADLCTN